MDPTPSIYSSFKVFAVIILCCLGIIIYSNTFANPFHFDDYKNIVENLSIRNLGKLGAIWKFWPTRFITYLSFAFNYHLHQLRVFDYHLFNLTIHLCTTILVWWFTLLTFATPAMKNDKVAKHTNLIAFLVAAMFVSHPIQTQAVTYIVQRATSLAALFYLLSLCLYVKSRVLEIEKNDSKQSHNFYYLVSLTAGSVGMFTKEMIITLPLAIVVYELCFLKMRAGLNWRKILPFFIISLTIPLTMLVTKSVNFGELRRVSEHSPNMSPWTYLLTQFRVIITYLRLLFIPLNQNLDYDYPIAKTLLEPATFVSFLFLVLILIIAIRISYRYRLVSFAIFWFFLILSPESSIVPIQDVIFEHRLYLPMVGYSLFLVGIIYYRFGRHILRPMVIILLMLIACYSILTYSRNFIWKDEFTLWNDTVRKSPQKARPYNGRGTAYADKGNFDQAISDFSKAIEIEPNYAEAYYNRGFIYQSKGNFDQTITDFSKAIEIEPNFVDAYYNRGNAYADKGKFDQAVSDFDKAIQINPNYDKAYNNRGNAYADKGNLNQAIADFNKAIEINPNYANAYYNRGIAYFFKQEYSKSWENVHKAGVLGYKVSPEFFDELKKASKRER